VYITSAHKWRISCWCYYQSYVPYSKAPLLGFELKNCSTPQMNKTNLLIRWQPLLQWWCRGREEKWKELNNDRNLSRNGLGMRLATAWCRFLKWHANCCLLIVKYFAVSVLLWSAQRLLYRGCLLSAAWTPVCVLEACDCINYTFKFFSEVLFCKVSGKGYSPSLILQWRRTVGSNISAKKVFPYLPN